VRLFVALQIPEDVHKAIAAQTLELKPLDDSWKWTRPESLHVTLKFLGEIPENKSNHVTEALRAVSADLPMTLTFKGLGFFPNERRPRVLWLGIEAPRSLPALAASIDAVLAGVGVPREERPFTPHLTLARSKAGIISPKLHETLRKYSAREFGIMVASAFHLIESRLKSTGAEYTTLQSFPGGPES
jgi:2'-5' RNA ligase